MTSPIQAVVCAIDRSRFSSFVVRHGAALARHAGGRLILLHAVHDPQDGAHPTTVFERGGGLIHLADDARRCMGRLLADAGVQGEVIVRHGEPVEQTLAVIADLPPCLIVSASHGVSGFRRLMIGTVVERLSRALDMPMLVVKPPADAASDGGGFRRIVVGCDGAGHWRHSAPLLRLLQAEGDVHVHFVHAMEGPREPFDTADADSAYGQAQAALQERSNRRLLDQARALSLGLASVSAEAAPGIPAEMVLHAIRRQSADVVVVGVRRSGRLARWISGSTTEALLRRSTCSVLTLPEHPSPADDPAGPP